MSQILFTTNEEVDLWRYSLVLLARNIPHKVVRQGQQYCILVPDEFLDQALYEIEAYHRENQRPRKDKVKKLNCEGVFWSFFLLTALLMLTFEPTWQEKLFAFGAGDTSLVKQGEWWRGLTALFLHKDPAHLLGNMFFGALFMCFLRARLSFCEAWGLTLASGALGNLLNLYLRPGPHASIGFSTAVFGEIGLLAALGGTNLRKEGLLSAGFILAFLGLLGAGKGVDLGAHLFGALFGFLLGKLTRRFKSSNE